jgi:hypothetical protein
LGLRYGEALFLWGEGIKMALEGRSAKNKSGILQKAKVKCHKKPKLFGGIRENP